MPQTERNSFKKVGWILKKVKDRSSIEVFDCGNADLNEYFRHDALAHRIELLTETYCLKIDSMEFDIPIALIGLCNDAIRSEKLKFWTLGLDKKKRYSSYPAVKITRFGVNKIFQREHIGSFTMNMIKEFFITDNRTGCRFIVVDAYNEKSVLNFYKHNNFQFLSEKDKNRKTRAMFYDLKRLQLFSYQ